MIKIGIDIGGTFTDAVGMDESTGAFWSSKVPTTYPDPSESFVNALDKLLAEKSLDTKHVALVIHGTTLVTNAIIERRGGPAGLLATEGFGDTLWIRTERRYDLFDVMIEFPDPLVSRRHVIEVPERIRYNGEVVTPLDEAAMLAGVDRLVEDGVNSVAVSYLHSYSNPDHEQRTASLILEKYPQLRLSLSSEVWPESGEYHRTSTTVANAYVQPITEAYLHRLTEVLQAKGFAGKFYLMLSNGGTAAVKTGRKLPIQLIESGPAAGVLAATYLAEHADLADVLSFDMGGTTAKLSLIEDGEPLVADLVEAARLKRHMPGSGIPIKVPVVDLLEIGSGGGSVARIDHMGLLKVGPHSAGSDPGPACYGWGGEEPTVTDADLLLGYLNADYFLGGEMPLDVEAARRVIKRNIAERTDLDLVEAAWGIHEVVNQNMALAAKMHVLERGHDPTHYAMVAYGGAGPVHAYGMARALGVRKVVVPPSAGVAASLGLLVAPIAFDLVQTLRMPLPGCEWDVLRGGIEALEAQGTAILREADVPPEEILYARNADMRFIGQGFEVTVPIPRERLDADQAAAILAAFQQTYRARYAHLPSEDDNIEFVRLRMRAWTPTPPPRLPRAAKGAGTIEPLAHREAYFGDAKGFIQTPVFRWKRMAPGKTVAGPAIVEAFDTTVVVGPHGQVTMDEALYLTLELEGGDL